MLRVYTDKAGIDTSMPDGCHFASFLARRVVMKLVRHAQQSSRRGRNAIAAGEMVAHGGIIMPLSAMAAEWRTPSIVRRGAHRRQRNAGIAAQAGYRLIIEAPARKPTADKSQPKLS